MPGELKKGLSNKYWMASFLNLKKILLDQIMLEFYMPKGKSDKLVFKEYDQHQIELLPQTADELIHQNHLVRVVDNTIDKMDLEPLLQQYKYGGGASRYSPLMILKIFVYAYSIGIFSSRKIAKELRENIHFMWLSGKQRPDFRTINKFRKTKLQPVVHEVFIASVKLLAAGGYVKLDDPARKKRTCS